jgi:hypothetical protein
MIVFSTYIMTGACLDRFVYMTNTLCQTLDSWSNMCSPKTPHNKSLLGLRSADDLEW